MTEKTLEQVLAEQKADFDRAVDKLTREGFWEKAKEAWGIPIHESYRPVFSKKIQIQKSPNADTRTAKGEVSKDELLRSTEMHISDVQKGLAFFADKLIEAGSAHDNTKISDLDGFYKLAQASFKDDDFRAGGWFKKHVSEERHHLTDHVPDDVTLIDVLERISDITMAGLARSGDVYADELDPEILQKAYQNTLKLLKQQVEVADKDDV